MEIPKIIHYCWFGRKPLPDLAKKCIASWRKYLPDYEIKEWNEDNFDVNIIPYTADAYKVKKYAFVSDYARFWILYHYGGLYFDTDVEVVKPMDEIISRGPFMGCEGDVGKGAVNLGVNPGLGLGVIPGQALLGELIEIYGKACFVYSTSTAEMNTVVQYTTALLIKHGLEDINEIQMIRGLYVYPKRYFCPMDIETGIISITDDTYCIHHYSGSWLSMQEIIRIKVIRILGKRMTSVVRYIKHLIVKPKNRSIIVVD